MKNKIENYKKFYRSKQGLMFVSEIENTGLRELVLTDYDFSSESGHQRYWDDCIENMDALIIKRKGINDMWIPGIIMHYGFGAFGSIFNDHKLKFTKDTSYMFGLDNSWDLKYDKDRFWSRMFIKCAQYISERANDRFFITPYPAPCPMDAANIIRESNLFTDIYEYEDELHILLNNATDGIIEHLTYINENTKTPYEGMMAFNRWIPGKCLILDDVGDLCSPEVYEKWIKPYTQRILNAFRGGYIHHHSLGKHQFKNISQYDNLYVQQISSDPSEPRPVNDLNYIFEQTSGSNVAIDLEVVPDEVLENIDKLIQGKFILQINFDNLENAVEFYKQIDV